MFPVEPTGPTAAYGISALLISGPTGNPTIWRRDNGALSTGQRQSAQATATAFGWWKGMAKVRADVRRARKEQTTFLQIRFYNRDMT
jgi:hypothetical protein